MRNANIRGIVSNMDVTFPDPPPPSLCYPLFLKPEIDFFFQTEELEVIKMRFSVF